MPSLVMDEMMKFQHALFALLPSFLLFGCNSDSTDSGEVCTAEAVPAISVSVIDDQTGDLISCGATLEIQDTGFEETVTNTDGDSCDNNAPLEGAFERPGYYNLTVYKEGYEYWYEYNVEVPDGDECHVETVDLEARLISAE